MSGNTWLNYILLSLVPCSHKNQSWPMRLANESGAHRTCLNCGQRLRYSLLDPENSAAPDNAVGLSDPQSATAAALLCTGAILLPVNRSD